MWVEEGQTATLVCTATGQPAPTITWSKVDGGLGSNHQIDGKLTLPSVKLQSQGPRRGRAGGASAPQFFGNFKELLRKSCFQPPHFESLFSPPTFKVAPRALRVKERTGAKPKMTAIQRHQKRRSN